MSEKLGPFRILDRNGHVLWEGELKEFVFVDEYGRRVHGEILPNRKETATVRKRKEVHHEADSRF